MTREHIDNLNIHHEMAPREIDYSFMQSRLYQYHKQSQIEDWGKKFDYCIYAVFSEYPIDEKGCSSASFLVLHDGYLLHEGQVSIPFEVVDGTYIFRPDISDLGKKICQLIDHVIKTRFLLHSNSQCTIKWHFIGANDKEYSSELGGSK